MEIRMLRASLRRAAAIWFSFWSALCVAALLALVLGFLNRVDGLLLYQTAGDMAVELAQPFLIVVVLAGLATLAATLLMLPLLMREDDRFFRACLALAPLSAIILCGALLIAEIPLWFEMVAAVHMPGAFLPPALFLYAGLLLYLLVRPGARQRLVEKAGAALPVVPTRRVMVAGTSAALGVTLLGEKLGAAPPARGTPSGRRPNILMVTFDALAAADTSLYGRGLPTTPHLDAFARDATTFRNHVSVSTFTTPAAATLLTGRYPSAHRVTQLRGRLHGANAEQTLIRELRRAGYVTAASIANPNAHPAYVIGVRDFDYLPPPPLRVLPLTNPARMLSSAETAAEAAEQ